MIQRRKTRQISIGSIKVGGDAPISVQSMTKTDTRDVRRTVNQIRRLEAAGCEIIRVAVVDEEAASAIAEIKKKIRIPLIADIHFHPHLALKASVGADGCVSIREYRVETVQGRCHRRRSAAFLSIGVNAGSLERDLLKRYGG
jgi:(E)-4-hydroxy-3-methylbut-2-enyl-diphosphate synthase